MRVNKNLIIGLLVVLLLIQGIFILGTVSADPYPPEAYMKVKVGNICMQTQEPIWDWIARQKFFVEAYGGISEEACW